MIELLIMIIIFVTIYKRVQRTKEEGGVKGNSSLPNTTVTTANQNNTFGQGSANPYEQKKPHGGMPAPRSAGRVQPRTAQAPVKSAIEEAREDGNSTTAYLMEKAEADAGSMRKKSSRSRSDFMRREADLRWRRGILTAMRFRRVCVV